MVVESTGLFTDADKAKGHLKGSVKVEDIRPSSASNLKAVWIA